MSLSENNLNTEEVKHDLGISHRQLEDKTSRKVFSRRRYQGNHTVCPDGYEASRAAFEKEAVCRFYLHSGACRYGSGCRYSHATTNAEASYVDPKESETRKQRVLPDPKHKSEICQFFARFGHCRYGRSCRYIHSYRKAELPAKTRVKDARNLCVSQEAPECSDPRDQTNDTSEGKTKAMGNAKPDADATPTGAPLPKISAEESLEALRDREIQQFVKRYRNCKNVESNDGRQRYNFIFRPTDPDWRFDIRELTLSVTFPSSYPKDYFTLNVYDDEAVLPSLLVRDLNKAIAKWLQDKHVANREANPNQLVMRPFLRWLDRSLEDLFIESLRKVKRIQLAEEAGIQFVPHEHLSSNNQAPPSSAVPEISPNEDDTAQDLGNENRHAIDSASHDSVEGKPDYRQSTSLEAQSADAANGMSTKDKHESTEIGEVDSSVKDKNDPKNSQQSCSSKEDSECVNSILPSIATESKNQSSAVGKIAQEKQVEKIAKSPAANGTSQAIVTNPKRGTEIKLRRLEMGENVGTLECQQISIRIQCTRCKYGTEVTTPARRRNVVTCGRCNKNVSAVFRSNMMHQFNSVIGYMDLTDCSVLDLVLPQCVFEAACLGCDKEMKIDGIHIAQQKVTWCQSCNSKLTLLLESVKFQNLLPAKSTDANGTFIIKAPKAAKKVKDPAIQEGRPLPDDGTCKHYKKSYRWLRFPCCGKAYPCDVCHEEHEGDHEMKYATRMICGHCAKEQPFSTDKPCIGCSGYMTKKVTAHWEGGRGCRDRIKMSRDDNKKYSGVGKTISKKAQATKPTGKK
ncbi:uncharacterized protein LOC135388648 [Ornithodoros turicata]|uniref:uncharacterized protein LOC135388648 n=1 Tax=Ornithodoros turicata TaxID=34597 RepID=UPI0031395AB4